ncbi:MAG TPA: DNA-directed RNA polymerase subunit A' [Candidatus Baltobacteraceae bacterium]|nr:DNA-directed RNA polymerase subunit A' [Candidatus Baltobacteraceae bacterium]
MQAEAIDYIRFTTVSPTTIKKMSVAKLIVPDTYNEDGYPIDGGLVDQRLGVIDPGLKCKTCGGRVKTCPGHFGHIELVRPVVHPEFSKTIYLLLQATCSNCHKLLLTDDQIADAQPLIRSIVQNEEIIDTANAPNLLTTIEEEDRRMLLIKKLKSVKKCPHCATQQPKIKLERPTFFYVNSTKLKPDELRDWLSKIPDDDLKGLGIDPVATRPEWLVLTVLFVPPVNVRPSITLESGERSEDDLTHKLVDIMRINQRLEQDIDAGAPQIIIDDLWELLQYQVTTYFNNETPGIPVARHRSTRPLKTLAQRLKGKEGRLRYNLSGKRVNFSARTVISVDASLTINQVGVPNKIAENLTIPIYVTLWNIDEAKKFLENKTYPTILNTITKEGIRKRITEANREEMLTLIEPGYILERQLIDGDISLLNRQPTLHRLSIMAHTVKVLPGKTMRIHVSATVPYNADFDGDEMNLHVPQSLEAQAEARYLMQPKDLMLSPRDGSPIMALEEDQIIGIYLLTRDGSFFDREETSILMSSVGIYEMPDAQKNGSYSGKSIFSMMLPDDLEYDYKQGQNHVVVKKGQLVDGTISEKLVGSNGALLLKAFEEYGSDYAMELLTNMAKMALRVTAKAGITISVKDYYNSDIVNKERVRIVSDVARKAEDLVEKFKEKKLDSLPGYTMKETLEIETMAELEEARSMASLVLNKHIGPENNTQLMAMVKARGNILNFVQTSMLLGQQAVRGRRPSRGYRGKILPYLKKGDKSPGARGFVESSFFEGLKPIEFFMHAMGSRDSAMSKSLVTAQSGYLQRRLINAMQDFYVDESLSVKDASGALIETLYGGDGVDPTMEKLAKRKENK